MKLLNASAKLLFNITRFAIVIVGLTAILI